MYAHARANQGIFVLICKFQKICVMFILWSQYVMVFLFLAKDYGLFLADEDVKKGVWLEPGRNLDYYILRNGVSDLISVLFAYCFLDTEILQKLHVIHVTSSY